MERGSTATSAGPKPSNGTATNASRQGPGLDSHLPDRPPPDAEEEERGRLRVDVDRSRDPDGDGGDRCERAEDRAALAHARIANMKHRHRGQDQSVADGEQDVPKVWERLRSGEHEEELGDARDPGPQRGLTRGGLLMVVGCRSYRSGRSVDFFWPFSS